MNNPSPAFRPQRVVHFLGGGNFGGGTVVVLSIVKAQIERGDQVTVFVNESGGAQLFRDLGAATAPVPCWRGPISPLDIVVFLSFWWLCLTRHIDLALTHTSKGGFLGRIAARLAGVPHVIHYIHGFGFHEFSPKRTRQVYVLLEKIAARFADMQIAVGDQHRVIAIEEGICRPHEVVTVLNGVDLTPFDAIERTAARAQFQFSDSDIILGASGRLATQKGFTYMLQAMPAILKEFPNAKFAICGTGELEQEHRAEAAALGITANVLFLGFRTDIREFLVASDVFVHPSLWEGLSISLMEAMGSATPIAASEIPGNVEMIEHERNGLLMRPKDPEHIAATILRMLRNREWSRALGQQAARDARQQFSIERMVAENIDVYDRVSGHRPVHASTKPQHA
jgi:glycosyltransferase involved in cell wall biosynthesis